MSRFSLSLSRAGVSLGRRAFGVALLGLVAAGLGCGASLDPAAKADIDQRVAGLRAGSEHVGSPGAPVARPLVPGQWSTYKLVDDKGQPGFFTYKVVGQDADATWIESVAETYHGKTVTKILVALGDRRTPEALDIRAIKLKDARGHVTSLDGPTLDLVKGLYRSAVNGLVVAWQGLPQEDASVLGGTFASCFKAQSSASFGPMHKESVTWSHPAVPVTGLVKSQSVSGSESMELVAYGETGAVSEL
jgi:hypothetical protein